jgi:hypothetical protein
MPTRIQPERITEVDGVAAREPIQIQPPRQPDRILLGEGNGCRTVVFSEPGARAGSGLQCCHPGVRKHG